MVNEQVQLCSTSSKTRTIGSLYLLHDYKTIFWKRWSRTVFVGPTLANHQQITTQRSEVKHQDHEESFPLSRLTNTSAYITKWLNCFGSNHRGKCCLLSVQDAWTTECVRHGPIWRFPSQSHNLPFGHSEHTYHTFPPKVSWHAWKTFA